MSRLVIESTLIAGFSKILAEKLIRLCGADTQEVLAAEQPPRRKAPALYSLPHPLPFGAGAFCFTPAPAAFHRPGRCLPRPR